MNKDSKDDSCSRGTKDKEDENEGNYSIKEPGQNSSIMSAQWLEGNPLIYCEDEEEGEKGEIEEGEKGQEDGEIEEEEDQEVEEETEEPKYMCLKPGCSTTEVYTKDELASHLENFHQENKEIISKKIQFLEKTEKLKKLVKRIKKLEEEIGDLEDNGMPIIKEYLKNKEYFDNIFG